jgi:hypothetical protein
MRRARRAPWLAALAVTACCGSAVPALASHTVFSASVDRFEIDGNAFGPADGVLDQVDEFDDGNLLPNWSRLVGTAVESGGVLTVRDPGTDVSLVPGVSLDVSNVENAIDVANGAGNFTATSYWVSSPLPGVNREIHFQLYGLGATIEAAGLTLQNLDAATAGPNPVGFSVTQSVSFVIGGGGVPQTDTVAIDPADITGQIVFRMAFDDATDTMVCSFSLDGGATFRSPFPPLHVFQVLDELEILLGAASITSTVPPPPPVVQHLVPTKLLLVKETAGPTSRKVTYQVKDPGPNGAFLGGSPPSAGATLNLLVGYVTQCFRLHSSGWRFSPSGFRYLDRGAHGPVKLVKIRRTANGTFQAKISILGSLGVLDIAPPNANLPAAMNLHLNGGPIAVEYCGSTENSFISANDARTFKVKDAPAPPTCTLNACSPSGAFLDETPGAF